jgi:hypothetical protein
LSSIPFTSVKDLSAILAHFPEFRSAFFLILFI